MYRPAILPLLTFMLAALAACGKTGDLYLPDDTETAGVNTVTTPVEQRN